MASIVVSGDTSGTITIAAPAVSGTNTLTLPAATGTVLTSASNTNFPAGSVLQVVQGNLNASVSTSSTSFVTTGLAASITPSSSSNKVLVTVSVADVYTGAIGQSAYFTIYRNSTNISPASGTGQNQAFSLIWSNTSIVQANATFSYLDSPATTSATTYTVYFTASAGTVTVAINNLASTIILQEVKG